jgi:hypothetical protein
MTRHPATRSASYRPFCGAAREFLRWPKDLPRLHPDCRKGVDVPQDGQNHSPALRAFPQGAGPGQRALRIVNAGGRR